MALQKPANKQVNFVIPRHYDSQITLPPLMLWYELHGLAGPFQKNGQYLISPILKKQGLLNTIWMLIVKEEEGPFSLSVIDVCLYWLLTTLTVLAELVVELVTNELYSPLGRPSQVLFSTDQKTI
jgi:hypothetical protein